jgi:predicted O-methyltransferase YrrM
MDLIFIDGSHAYSYVMSDTEKALKMLKKGGIVLWHDYRGTREAPDVFRALNELAEKLPIVHIAGTSLAAYRKV